MTARDALAEGRLTEAVALQAALVEGEPGAAPARLFLVELLTLAGRFRGALDHLARIDEADSAWPATARRFRQLIRAARRYSRRCDPPPIRPLPAALHARCRRRAVRALRDGDPVAATRWVDRADACTPEPSGFLDGQEFRGLRDADDCRASVLECVRGGRLVWLPWEAVRRVKIEPARYTLDRLLRPAHVRLADGAAFDAHLPLTYPGPRAADDAFALGLETDRVCPDDGPIRCVGGKLLLVGEEEVLLSECRMIEVRGL